MKQETRKLVLSVETLMRLQPPVVENPDRAAQFTQPTTTTNTSKTGCC